MGSSTQPGPGAPGGPGQPSPAIDMVALADLSPDGMCIVDLDGRVRHLNPMAEAMIGRSAAWCRGRHAVEFVHPDDLMLVLSSLSAVRDKERGTPIEVRVADGAGAWRWLEVVGRDCRDVPGIEGIVCTARDLTERRMWEVAANDITHFQQVVQHAAAIVMSVSADGTVTGVNGAFGRLLGHDPSEVVGAPLPSFAAPGFERAVVAALADAAEAGASSLEVPMRHARGPAEVPVRLELVDLTDDPVVANVVVTGHDVSDLHEARKRLEHMATHDALTGLPNRTLLDQRLAHLLATGRSIAVLFIDLDDFKAVNDTRGHEAGDELLRYVARRLTDGVAAGDVVARVGGDEFVVVAVDVPDPSSAGTLADRLAVLLRAPYGLSSGPARIGASVGAIIAGPGMTARDVLAEADSAMYSAKGQRRQR